VVLDWHHDLAILAVGGSWPAARARGSETLAI
jgi:hypothetical protein